MESDGDKVLEGVRTSKKVQRKYEGQIAALHERTAACPPSEELSQTKGYKNRCNDNDHEHVRGGTDGNTEKDERKFLLPLLRPLFLRITRSYAQKKI